VTLSGVLAAKPSAWGKGRFGYLKKELPDVRDEWKQPVFNVANPRTASLRDRAGAGEILGGWLPSKAFEREWLESSEGNLLLSGGHNPISRGTEEFTCPCTPVTEVASRTE
jgi:hypothetical protein